MTNTTTLYVVHPRAPQGVHPDPQALGPYSEALFTLPKIHFTLPSAKDMIVEKALSQGGAEILMSLNQDISSGLPDFKREADRADIGFFNQGVVTGGVIFLSTVVMLASLGYYHGFGMARQYLL